jgi:hypothetical protein
MTGEHAVIGGADEAYGQAPELSLVGADRLTDRFFCQRHDASSLRQEHEPGRGDLYASPGAVEQPDPDFLFQLPDLLAERRLRNVQSFRGSAEMKLFGNGDK